MVQNSTQVINNWVLRELSLGKEFGDITNQVLAMKMENDLGVEQPMVTKSPSVSDIHVNLIGNGIIDQKDFGIEMCNVKQIPIPRLAVHIAPSVSLFVERKNGILSATINDDIFRAMSLRGRGAENIAKWIIRQKQNYEQYMDECQAVLTKMSKKIKGNRMAMLAIKAIFSEAMKCYPHLCYDFVEQKKRMRIKVKLPNSRLGVVIDAWWGSYKERLPQQIEDLKALIDVHIKTSLKNFYISYR